MYIIAAVLIAAILFAGLIWVYRHSYGTYQSFYAVWCGLTTGHFMKLRMRNPYIFPLDYLSSPNELTERYLQKDEYGNVIASFISACDCYHHMRMERHTERLQNIAKEYFTYGKPVSWMGTLMDE